MVDALDIGHPGVPAALGRIGGTSVAALTQVLFRGGPIEQRDAALAILLMVVHGDQVSEEALVMLHLVKGTSQYLDVGVYATAALVWHAADSRPPVDEDRIRAQWSQRPLCRNPGPYDAQRIEDWAKMVAKLAHPFPEEREFDYNVGWAVLLAYGED